MNLRPPDLGRLLDRAIDTICAYVLFGMLAVTAVDVVVRYPFQPSAFGRARNPGISRAAAAHAEGQTWQ